jgi:hypothetical protein
MMNKLIVFFGFLIAIGCNRKPFVEHKVDFEKVATNCSEQQSYFRMSSNFGGERFEFEKCLGADFKKDQVTSSRQGDTVLVKFPQPAAGGNVVYHITLDIDSYPEYNYVTIGEDTYQIAHSKN